jgi:hypothetical protein
MGVRVEKRVEGREGGEEGGGREGGERAYLLCHPGNIRTELWRGIVRYLWGFW